MLLTGSLWRLTAALCAVTGFYIPVPLCTWCWAVSYHHFHQRASWTCAFNCASIHSKESWSLPTQQCRCTTRGGGRETCSHEKRAAACYRCSSSPAVDAKSQQICRDNKFIFTIHTADRVGVRFCKAALRWGMHAHLPAHSPSISKAIIWVRRKVKNIKYESCRGTCQWETLLCHYSDWQLFRGEAFLNVKEKFDLITT